MWAVGTDSYGQCGTGFASPFVHTPVRVGGALMHHRVVSISAGEYHSLAVTADGDIFSWGLNKDGACASGDRADVGSPWLVNASDPKPLQGHATPGRVWLGSTGRVSEASGGGGHTLLLTDTGTLFAVGRGRSGQLGRGNAGASRHPESSVSYKITPVEVLLQLANIPVTAGDGASVVSIAAGRDHSLAVVQLPAVTELESS